MFLRSVAIPADSTIDLRHAHGGVGGENLAPDLSWGDAPEGTRSFMVTCYDPDAPTGSGWWHWVLTDIPADVTSIPAGGVAPAGARDWPTDYGVPGWGGPWPPPGHPAHHYHFRVAALDVDRLDIPDDAPRAMALLTAGFHVLADAEFVALFANPAS
ncbi:MAG: YbhB/YbcL family Raf kinase inhibitor-like protein [Propionicimonas sp.]